MTLLLGPKGGNPGNTPYAHRLRDFDDPGAGCGRIEGGQDVGIQAGSVHSYDQDGLEYGPTTVWFPDLDY